MGVLATTCTIQHAIAVNALLGLLLLGPAVALTPLVWQRVPHLSGDGTKTTPPISAARNTDAWPHSVCGTAPGQCAVQEEQVLDPRRPVRRCRLEQRLRPPAIFPLVVEWPYVWRYFFGKEFCVLARQLRRHTAELTQDHEMAGMQFFNGILEPLTYGGRAPTNDIPLLKHVLPTQFTA
jgi:hypothetical protein